MAGFGRGLSSLNDEIANAPVFGKGQFINRVSLADDKERVKLRFLTDADDMLYGTFHRVKATGEKGGQFIDMVPCLPGCEECKKSEPAQKQKLIFLWAWVYNVLHKNRYGKGSEDWPEKIVGRSTFYNEKVNGVRLFRFSAFYRGDIDLAFDEANTIVDRDYDWVRSGVKGTTKPSYSLKQSGTPSELPENMLRWIDALPSLENVAMRKVRTLPELDEQGNPIPPGEGSRGEGQSSRPAKSDDEELVDISSLRVGNSEDEEGLPF